VPRRGGGAAGHAARGAGSGATDSAFDRDGFQRRTRQKGKERKMTTPWFLYAVAAALLYGLHQVFTKLAADRIGDGLGGFVVEATAAAVIAAYLGALWLTGNWNQTCSAAGVQWSVVTGVCVGAGTLAFFLLF